MRTEVAPDVLTIRWSLTWVKDDCRALHKHQQHVGFDFSLQDFWHKTDKTIDSTLQNMPNENVQIRSPLFLVLRESVHWTREAKRKSSCWRVECTDCSVHLWLTQLIVLQWRCWWPFFKVYAPAVRDLIYQSETRTSHIVNCCWGLFHAHNKILTLTASVVGVHSLAQLKTRQLCNI